jgi:glutaredoxin
MVLRRLFAWWKGPQNRRHGDLHVVMLTRHGCHLCDQAWELLQRLQRAHGFQLQAVDVDTNRQLAAEHGDWVPVIMVNGKVRFRGGLNGVLFKRLLDTIH